MSLILTMILFSLATSISPGPVNIIALSIGTNKSFRAAIPFVSGATIGFTLLLFLLGLGLDQLLNSAGSLMNVLNILGSAFICFMGFKIATSKGGIELERKSTPSFSQGFLLQWLNPKAWAACLAGLAAFETANSFDKLSLFTVTYLLICFIGIGSWALAGEKIFAFFQTPQRLQIFNIAMGCALILLALILVLPNALA